MSWFKRKSRNRRNERDYVLDVKLRSDQVRASRMRVSALTLALTFATIFVLVLIWRGGQWALDRLVYQNPAFAIQEIDVQTDGILAIDQLRRWAGVKSGENLMALDLARVKRDLEMNSMIASVAVERVLPHSLRVRVSEREPVAQVYTARLRADGGYEMVLFQLDRDGYVMSLPDPRQLASPSTQTNEVLPVVAGIDPTLLAPGRRLDNPKVRAALQLISAFQTSPMAGYVDLGAVDTMDTEVLQVKTIQGSEITFSTDDFDRQLRRWREIYMLGQHINKSIATLDLSVPNNIPATWTDASGAPPVTPKIKTPQRNRRRNV
jgi:cell division septal protein FtsQ